MKQIRISLIASILLTVLFSFRLSAQNLDIDKKYMSSNVKFAEKYMERGEPYEALKYYAKESEENPDNHYANFQLGNLYYELFDYKQSQRFYSYVVLRGGYRDFPLSKYWYGVTLKMNGEYVKAKEVLTEFINEFSPGNPKESIILDKAKLEFEGARIAMKEMKKKERNYEFEILNRPANSGADEYAPTIINDSSFIMTTDRKGVMQDIKDKENGIFYSDNYRVSFDTRNNRWVASKKMKLLSQINTYKSDGPGSFTADGNKYYYTSCANVEEGCEIFVSTKSRGGWSEGVKLNENINQPKSENKQPFVTPKGDTLFFVSERSDGVGMQDIWYSIRQGKGENWGKAINLGPNVNTPFIDMSPSYYPGENTLFFASDGRSGFGGMDMYMAKGENFEFVKDLGMPFNSSRNDFYMVLGEQRGFFASDRIEGGMGKTDVYTFIFPSKKEFIRLVASEYVNDFREYTALTKLKYGEGASNVAVNVDVKLVDEKGNVLKTTRSDSRGFARFENIPTDKNYRIVIDTEDPKLKVDMQYFVDDIEVVDNLSLVYKKDMPVAKLEMERKGSEFSYSDFKGFALLGKMKVENADDPAIGIPLVLLNDEGQVVKKIRTNTRGLMRFENLASDKNYRVEIDTEDPNYDPSMKVMFDDLQLKRYDEVAENVKFENIYFGFGSKEIDPESAKVLDKLATYYKQNPNIQVDISAYTDTVGNEEFNRKLSEERANAVLNYLRDKNIDEASLVLFPMGEDKAGASMPAGAADTDDKGNRYSRRVEFFIVQSPEDKSTRL
ncbi:OmpA family protein [Hyphobacterium sp. CCMP332]|nr:OmpA family protein [Hyphobacterium sp. CCMP332]